MTGSFGGLLRELEARPRDAERLRVLGDWLIAAPRGEAVAAVALLVGRTPKRIVAPARLARWAAAESGVPDWLFAACRQATGDLGEATALIAPGPEDGAEPPLEALLGERWLALERLDEGALRREVTSTWRALPPAGRLLVTRLFGGTFRSPVPPGLVAAALADIAGLPLELAVHRLAGEWPPGAEGWRRLTRPASAAETSLSVAPGPEVAVESPRISLRAVLMYARAGHGGRGGQYTELTFGLWSEGELVPVARVADAVVDGLASWIRRHTAERYGPVRRVEPTQLFAIEGSALEPSSRHKAGWVLREPRVIEWLRERGPEAAHRLGDDLLES